MKKKEYKISVIIPVYNVEKYLEETIESVVNQTIGFDNIQMILVNDGSPDNSEEICLKYKEKYPDNVVYVKQENAGVSSARNNGLKHATGKYVNFFDSDDIWDKNAYEKAIKFLDSNLSVDLVAFRLIVMELLMLMKNLLLLYYTLIQRLFVEKLFLLILLILDLEFVRIQRFYIKLY